MEGHEPFNQEAEEALVGAFFLEEDLVGLLGCFTQIVTSEFNGFGHVSLILLPSIVLLHN